MSKYKYLLFDIDGTILNFKAAEKVALRATFKHYFGFDLTDENVKTYSKINDKYWEMLERGEMERKDILVERFKEFVSTFNLELNNPDAFNSEYQLALGDTICFNDDAYNLLIELKKKYRIVAITNGTAFAQEKKLRLSKLDQVFDNVYISEDVGYDKPNRDYFEYVLNDLKIERSIALIIGDSLTSDILGGINSSIDTVWYNPNKEINTKNYKANYEINNLYDIYKIVE